MLRWDVGKSVAATMQTPPSCDCASVSDVSVDRDTDITGTFPPRPCRWGFLSWGTGLAAPGFELGRQGPVAGHRARRARGRRRGAGRPHLARNRSPLPVVPVPFGCPFVGPGKRQACSYAQFTRIAGAPARHPFRQGCGATVRNDQAKGFRLLRSAVPPRYALFAMARYRPNVDWLIISGLPSRTRLTR